MPAPMLLTSGCVQDYDQTGRYNRALYCTVAQTGTYASKYIDRVAYKTNVRPAVPQRKEGLVRRLLEAVVAREATQGAEFEDQRPRPGGTYKWLDHVPLS